MSGAAADVEELDGVLDELIRRLSLGDKRTPDVRSALIEARRLKAISLKWLAIPPPPDARREFMSRIAILLAVAPEAPQPPYDRTQSATRKRWVPNVPLGTSSTAIERPTIHDEDTPPAESKHLPPPPSNRAPRFPPILDEPTTQEGASIRGRLKGSPANARFAEGECEKNKGSPANRSGRSLRSPRRSTECPTSEASSHAANARFAEGECEKSKGMGFAPSPNLFEEDTEPAPPTQPVSKSLAHAVVAPVSNRSRDGRITFLRMSDSEWQSLGGAPGVVFRELVGDPASGRIAAMLRLTAGAVLPGRCYEQAGEMIVLEGEAAFGGHVVRSGDCFRLEPGVIRPPLGTQTGCLLLFNGSRHDEAIFA